MVLGMGSLEGHVGMWSFLPQDRELTNKEMPSPQIEALCQRQAKPPIKEPELVKPSDFGRLSKNACGEDMTKLLFSLAKIQVDDIPERVPNETDRLVHSVSASLDALFRLQKSAETLRELAESSSVRHEDFMRRLDKLVFTLPCYLEN
ncbi:hypothetical protein HPB47_012932 [Ixodes persulcatus]|uniref:Uncharacterized protein n=1 Tax=Ixodes persulcatus TaxID=34615 RepID=A0AC60NS21_IXOPE|nr:hypothetical protein HPB47_012932 [Ixodes persulcatus]